MLVADLMTRDVATVRPELPLRAVAALLAERRVSGVPVVDDDRRPLGVVSEADILAKARGAARHRFDLLAWLSEWDDEEEEAKLRAVTAGEAMSTPAVVVQASSPVSHAAALMVDRGVNRLPVVDDEGRLVGILSRADVVRLFARPDAEIEREIREEVLAGALGLAPDAATVSVHDGAVVLRGLAAEDAGRGAGLASRIVGVVSVRSEPADED